MQAVILAAGKSERFYPFTFLSHKSMASLMGKTLLEHTLYSLEESEINEVIIVISNNSTVPEELSHFKPKKLKIHYVIQKETLGMGHALLQAKELLSDTFFLLSGYHLEFKTVYKDMLKKQKKDENVVLLAKKDSILERYGLLHTKGDMVTDVVERPDQKEEMGLRVIGIYLLNRSFLNTLEKIPTEHYHFEKALAEYAKKDLVLYTETDQPTITLKYSWDLLQVKDYLLSSIKRHISDKASVSSHAIIQGNVYLSEGVVVMEGACVKGPCFLGKGVIVGNNAILRSGVIVEEGGVVGAGMEIKNSILMKQATTHTGFIGDSIIGPHCRLAAGFCSANVRFDRGMITAKIRDVVTKTYRTHIGVIMGQHVDTGINVSTMPGICIGNNVTIGPGTMVMENVDDNTTIYTKFETLTKKKNE